MHKCTTLTEIQIAGFLSKNSYIIFKGDVSGCPKLFSQLWSSDMYTQTSKFIENTCKKLKILKMKKNNKLPTTHTCKEEPCTYQNWHKDENAIPRAATFSCNECSHQALSSCNLKNDGKAILNLYKLHICKVPDPY